MRIWTKTDRFWQFIDFHGRFLFAKANFLLEGGGVARAPSLYARIFSSRHQVFLSRPQAVADSFRNSQAFPKPTPALEREFASPPRPLAGEGVGG